jgi:hypothetical protein
VPAHLDDDARLLVEERMFRAGLHALHGHPRTASVFEVVPCRPSTVLRSWSQAAALVVVGVSHEQAPKRSSLAERCARVAVCPVRTVPFSVTFSGNRGSPHVQPGEGEPKTLSDLRGPVRHGVARRGERVLLT